MGMAGFGGRTLCDDDDDDDKSCCACCGAVWVDCGDAEGSASGVVAEVVPVVGCGSG